RMALLGRRVLVVDGVLTSSEDVVTGAAVDPQVGREVVDRLLVARDRIDVVDRPVVPVVQEALPARNCRGRTRRRVRGERRRSSEQAAQQDNANEARAGGTHALNGQENVSGGDGDESPGRSYAPGIDCVRLLLPEPGTVRPGC